MTPYLGPLLLLLVPQATPHPRDPRLPEAPETAAVDVPLIRLPGEASLGFTVGASFLDYDGDGWIDVYVNWTAELRRNVGGNAFPLVADLDTFLPPLPPSFVRYGASCADYDNDGFPDIAGEPHGGVLPFLLKNLGGTGEFLDVSQDPEIVPAPLPPHMAGETFCWADVDEDGDLDLFEPAYPDEFTPGSGGNHFYENLGATGPGGAYRFALSTGSSGLGIPRGVNRPEGAQFADVDRDGDLDLYSNGTLYQNVSGEDGPRFRPLDGNATGITFGSLLDEGVLFFDYDMDGDQDLLVLHANVSNDLYENRGDGTFVEDEGALEAPADGTSAGCSAADWDMDGDLDLTTGSVFRRNLLVETGERFLRVATHSLGSLALGALLPAWGDWDKDGDLDCALATFGFPGTLLRNTTYRPTTPVSHRLALRVRPVMDSMLVPNGLETGFGASVEVCVRGDAPGRIRRNFTASSHGYLQQSEYALTFGLPPGPDADAPASGVVLDLAVDFPSRGDRGLLRIDRSVNPVLGGLELASLEEREISVFRSGLVRIDGVDHPAVGRFTPRLASTGRLALPGPGAPLPDLAPAPAASWFAGIEFDTSAAPGPTKIEELVLDGELEPASSARCDANVVLWDVTPGETPRAVREVRLTTSERNARSFLPLPLLLKPHRVYRLVCRVRSLRGSPLETRFDTTVANRGGLSFTNPNPCDGAAVLAAPLHADRAFLELRYRSVVRDASVGGRRR